MDEMLANVGLFALFVFFVVFELIFNLPTIVAISRKHNSALGIFILNTFLGMTIIGWIVALVWACGSNVHQCYPYYANANPVPPPMPPPPQPHGPRPKAPNYGDRAAATVSAFLIGILILGGIGAIVDSYIEHMAKIAHQTDQNPLDIRPAIAR
jgi:hypothetical protein